MIKRLGLAKILFQTLSLLGLVLLVLAILVNVVEPGYISTNSLDVLGLLGISALSGVFWLASVGFKEPAVLPVTIGVLGLTAIASIFAIMDSSQSFDPFVGDSVLGTSSYQESYENIRRNAPNTFGQPPSGLVSDSERLGVRILNASEIDADISIPFEGTDSQKIAVRPEGNESEFYRLTVSGGGNSANRLRVRIELSNSGGITASGDPYLVLYSVDSRRGRSLTLSEVERNDDGLIGFGALIDRALIPGRDYIIEARDFNGATQSDFWLEVVDVSRRVSDLPSQRLEVGAVYDSGEITMLTEDTHPFAFDVDGQGEPLCLAALLVPVDRRGDTRLSLSSSSGVILEENDDYDAPIRSVHIPSQGFGGDNAASNLSGSREENGGSVASLSSFISREIPANMKQAILDASAYNMPAENHITFALMVTLHKRTDFDDCRQIAPSIEFARRYGAIDEAGTPN